MPLLLRLSFLYFALVFTAGFILGTLRVLLLVPAIGERYAELVEMPFMMLACGFVSGYLVRKYRDNLTRSKAIHTGLMALVMLLAIEFTVVLTLRGLSLSEYFAARDAIAGGAYLIGLLWYAIAPWGMYVLNTPESR